MIKQNSHVHDFPDHNLIINHHRFALSHIQLYHSRNMVLLFPDYTHINGCHSGLGKFFFDKQWHGRLIKSYNDFNDYYADANALVRTKNKDFHVFRFNEIGDGIVSRMGPFRKNYYHFALARGLLLIRRYKRALKTFFSSTKKINLQWLERIHIAALIAYISISGLYIINGVFEFMSYQFRNWCMISKSNKNLINGQPCEKP